MSLLTCDKKKIETIRKKFIRIVVYSFICRFFLCFWYGLLWFCFYRFCSLRYSSVISSSDYFTIADSRTKRILSLAINADYNHNYKRDKRCRLLLILLLLMLSILLLLHWKHILLMWIKQKICVTQNESYRNIESSTEYYWAFHSI